MVPDEQEAGCVPAFPRRVVRHLPGEAGIRQFLDIGSELPTETREQAAVIGCATWVDVQLSAMPPALLVRHAPPGFGRESVAGPQSLQSVAYVIRTTL
ncbi:SAM-dependent methyltransferase [Micromonospora sp. D93]|nr:SAM-dependent methyltransferase [Micromonospora sp. D93]